MKPVEAPERYDNQPIIEMSMLESLREVEHLHRLQSIDPTWQMFENAYNAVREYYAANGNVPAAGFLAMKIEGWSPQPGTFDYWFDQYQHVRAANDLQAMLSEALKEVRNNPQEVASGLVSKIHKMVQTSESTAVAGDYTIWDRVEQYEARVAEAEATGKRMRGIKTGFGIIDQTMVGWQPSELIGCMARPAVGKTWILVRQAVVAWLQGKRILLVSTEMSAQEVLGRFDTLLAGHTGKGFSHRMAQESQRPMVDQYHAVAEFVRPDRAEIEKRFWVIDRRLSIPEIDAMTTLYAADVVLIDNMMQLKSLKRGSANSYEYVQEYIYGLRDIALRTKAVVFVTHHTVNKARGKKSNDAAKGVGNDFTMPSADDAAYGDAFYQACSTVVAMAPDEFHSNLRWYAIRKSRERGNVDEPIKAALLWDVDRGVIIDAVDCELSMDKLRVKMREYNVQPG